MTLHFDRIRQNAGFGQVVKQSEKQPNLDNLLHPIAQHAALAHALNQFMAAGVQVFSLGSLMCETFERMSIANIEAQMVLLPYNTFYLHMPTTTLTMARQKDGERVPVEGTYVHKLTSGDWLICVIAHADKDALFAFCWPQTKWVSSQLSFEEFIDEHYVSFEQEQHELPTQMITMIMHTCLYLSSEGAQTEDAAPNTFERLQRKANKAKGSRLARLQEQMLEVTCVNKSVLAPDLEQMAALLDDEQRALHRAHMVRAHWKRQRYGEGRKKVKTIMVMPYIRGEGELNDETRIYTLN